jgi:hypothetical protein
MPSKKKGSPFQDPQPPKLDLNDFITEGYLQEANRQFFHIHGLALAVQFRGEKPVGMCIYDARDDPEGFVFEDDAIDYQKTARVFAERLAHANSRRALFQQSSEMQPVKVPDDVKQEAVAAAQRETAGSPDDGAAQEG